MHVSLEFTGEKIEKFISLDSGAYYSKPEWYNRLKCYKNDLFFYIQNKDFYFLTLLRLLQSLNRRCVLLCNFEISDILGNHNNIVLLRYRFQERNKKLLEYEYFSVLSIILEVTRPECVFFQDKEYTGMLLCQLAKQRNIRTYELSIIENGGIQALNKFNQLKCDETKLHIGCGDFLFSGWLNVDLQPCNCDVLYMDAMRPFPFEDSCFDYIYAEHLFEHLDYSSGKRMLNEVYRVLTPDGIVRLAMPSLEFLIKIYKNRYTAESSQYIQWSMSTFNSEEYKEFTDNIVPAAIVINKFMRLWGHKMIYDKLLIYNTLEKIGFKNIHFCEIGQSSHSVLKGIEHHDIKIPSWANKMETMVVEAEKKML